MDGKEFYEHMMKPGSPDRMNFQMTRDDPDLSTTFSLEGIQNITNQIHDFIMARIMGQWKKTGVPPSEIKIHVALDFRKHFDISIETYPWYDFVDVKPGEHVKALDGSNRKVR